MKTCLKCAGPLQKANGVAIYNIGERLVIGSKVLGVYFEFEIGEKNYCSTCMITHYDLASMNEDELLPAFLLCPAENRIGRRRI